MLSKAKPGPCCLGHAGIDVRLVRMRVVEKANMYHTKPISLCSICRKHALGRWKYADVGEVAKQLEKEEQNHEDERG